MKSKFSRRQVLAGTGGAAAGLAALSLSPTRLLAGEKTVKISTRIPTDFHIIDEASGGAKFVELEIKDSGPGIPDVKKAMQPGFSTASEWVRELGFGAGMGLVNIKKCADKISLTSKVGKGTHLKITIDIDSTLHQSKAG